MKGTSKVLLGAASVLLTGGILMAVGGWATGAEHVMTVELAGHPVQVGFWGIEGSRWPNTEPATEWSGGDSRDGEDHLAAFQKLDVDISMGDVIVLAGEDFGVDLSWRGQGYELHYENKDGKLRVWSTSTPAMGVNMGGYGGTVTVCIPEGTKLDDVTVTDSLGDVDIYSLHTDRLTVDADMGDVALTGVTAKDMELDLSLGDLNLASVEADNLDMDLDMGALNGEGVTTAKSLIVSNSMGDIWLTGTFQGKNDLDADMGDVYFTTYLDEDEYAYELDVSMGDIFLDGYEQKDHVERGSGSHSLKITNSMGDIDVNFG